MESKIFALRTAANREDQVVDYLISKLQRDTKSEIFSIIRPHGMRGYIFVEASSNLPDNQAAGKMIEILNTYLGLNIDTKPLAQKAKEFEEKIKSIFSKVAEAQVKKDEKKLSYMG